MMHRRCYLHHLLADVNTYFHMFGKDVGNEFFSFAFFPVGYIQIDCTVPGASSFFNLLINSSCYFVASSEFEALWLVTLHKAFSQLIFENTSIPPDLFCHESSALFWRISHARWMKLDHFHINKFSSYVQRPRVAFASVAGCVGIDLIHVSTPTCRHNGRFCLHNPVCTCLPINKKGAYYLVALPEQFRHIVIFQVWDVKPGNLCQ